MELDIDCWEWDDWYKEMLWVREWVEKKLGDWELDWMRNDG